VRRRLLGPAAAAAVGALGVAAAIVAGASPRTAADAYLLFLGALVALALVQAAAGERPDASTFERARVRRERELQRPEELERLERQLYLALATTADGERLRLALREVAVQRLDERAAVDLERDPDGAHALLGDTPYELVREGPHQVREPFGPGLPLDAVRETIEACERL
jgi:hypothetical protein